MRNSNIFSSPLRPHRHLALSVPRVFSNKKSFSFSLSFSLSHHVCPPWPCSRFSSESASTSLCTKGSQKITGYQSFCIKHGISIVFEIVAHSGGVWYSSNHVFKPKSAGLAVVWQVSFLNKSCWILSSGVVINTLKFSWMKRTCNV